MARLNLIQRESDMSGTGSAIDLIRRLRKEDNSWSFIESCLLAQKPEDWQRWRRAIRAYASIRETFSIELLDGHMRKVESDLATGLGGAWDPTSFLSSSMEEAESDLDKVLLTWSVLWILFEQGALFLNPEPYFLLLSSETMQRNLLWKNLFESSTPGSRKYFQDKFSKRGSLKLKNMGIISAREVLNVQSHEVENWGLISEAWACLDSSLSKSNDFFLAICFEFEDRDLFPELEKRSMAASFCRFKDKVHENYVRFSIGVDSGSKAASPSLFSFPLFKLQKLTPGTSPSGSSVSTARSWEGDDFSIGAAAMGAPSGPAMGAPSESDPPASEQIPLLQKPPGSGSTLAPFQ